jgi:hypothetical protein
MEPPLLGDMASIAPKTSQEKERVGHMGAFGGDALIVV